MEQVNQEITIELFANELPQIDQIEALSEQTNSSEIARMEFIQKLDQNIDKTDPQSSLGAGIGLYIVGRYTEAVEKLKNAKDCKEKYLYTAYALRKLGKFDQAIEALQKSLDYEADSLTVSLEKAATYCCAANLEAAAAELDNCANFRNVSAEYHYQLGYLQECQGLYGQALNNYKLALELSPNHKKSLFRLAYRSDLLGDEDAAIDYYKQIASTRPVYINALLNLAVLYEDMAKYEKASQCVEKVLRHFPNHKRALLFKKDIDSSKTMFYDEEVEKRMDRKTQILETPISDFELSVRSRNCFKKMNISTLGDLVNISEAELLSYKNFGETSLKEIKIILESKGLQLGVPPEENMSSLPGQEGMDELSQENQGILSKSVDDLKLSVRSRKCLQKLDIHIIGDLTRRTEAELLGCKNFGITSLDEIKIALNEFGLALRSLD